MEHNNLVQLWLIQLTTMNPLNYFQIQPNSRGLMHRPDWVLSNPTFKSYITETKFQKSINKSYQKNTKVARAHWLSEVHKSFKRVPSFWPIIGTVSSLHYNVGKDIKLLNPLIQNKCSLKDTFEMQLNTSKRYPKN